MVGQCSSVERLGAVTLGGCRRLNSFDQGHSVGPGGEPRQPGGDDGFSDARVRAGDQYNATHALLGEEAWREEA